MLFAFCSESIVKKENMQFKGKWIELETTTLGEITKIKKDKYYIFSHF